MRVATTRAASTLHRQYRRDCRLSWLALRHRLTFRWWLACRLAVHSWLPRRDQLDTEAPTVIVVVIAIVAYVRDGLVPCWRFLTRAAFLALPFLGVLHPYEVGPTHARRAGAVVGF